MKRIPSYIILKTPVIVVYMTVTMFMPIVSHARLIIEKKLEPAILEIRYNRHMVRDTLDRDNDYKDDILTLKIGKTVSAFYSAERKYTDSLEYRNRDFAMMILENKELWKSVAKLPIEALFKNYPEGKIRVHDRFDMSQWIIDEDIEKPEWTIADSVMNIMGYECILAVSDFRGRRWEAWFCPDIPVQEGPWKLCGLPGLILKAQDTKRHYVYDALTLRTEGIGDVEYFDYYAGNRFTTTREKALPVKWKWLHEDVGYKIVSSGMYGISSPNLKKRDVIPHSNYDFEEIDYPHEP